MGLRLLLLAENYRWQGTGLEHSAVRMCRGLANRGHDVHILCDHGEPHDRVQVHQGLGNVASVKHRLSPDLVIDWGFHHTADIHRMGAGTHEGYLKYYMEAFHGWHRKIKELEKWMPKHQRVIRRQKRHLSNPNAWFIANSKMTADLAIEGGVHPDRIEVCHQHIPLEEFNPVEASRKREALRQAWGVEGDETVFLFVAHNLKLKNYDLLRRIFERGNLGRSKLVVIGKHRPNHTAKWLIYGDLADDMLAVYGAADVLVHPTFFDSCANVALEAASCELPVIVSQTSGINEILPENWAFSVHGPPEIVASRWEEAMLELAHNRSACEKRGKEGRLIAQRYEYGEFLDWIEKRLEQASMRHQ